MKAFLADRRKAAAAVFLVALVLRLGFLWRQGPPAEIVGDAIEYRAYAVHVLDAGTYAADAGERATRMPGYPLFLAAVFAALGRSPLPVLILQSVLGAGTCVLLYGLAGELLPPLWAAGAGLAAAVSLDLIAPCSALLSECLFSFLLVLGARVLYKAEWAPGRRAAAFGVLSALLYLVRPEPLPYFLATALFLPYLFPRFGRRETLKALAAAALVASVWIGRNAAVFGRPVPASTVGKTVAYLALEIPANRLGLSPEPRHVAPSGLDELARDRDFALEYRALAARLSWPQLVRCYVLNLSLILYPFLPEYDWTYAVLVPFWLIGFALALLKDKRFLPPSAAVAFSLGIFIFFGGPASRYRQGIAPFLILLAFAGLKACADRVGARRLRLWGGAWLAVNVLGWLAQAQFRGAVVSLLSRRGLH